MRGEGERGGRWGGGMSGERRGVSGVVGEG